MHVDGYLAAVREDLARVAAVGDETTARAAELLAVALESSLGRRLQEALAEAALELSSQMPHGRVEVRIAGADPELVYVEDGPDPSAQGSDEAYSARLTVRLPERLKLRLDAAAAAQGISVNTWVVQGLSRLLERTPNHGGGGRRLTGYGRT